MVQTATTRNAVLRRAKRTNKNAAPKRWQPKLSTLPHGQVTPCIATCSSTIPGRLPNYRNSWREIISELGNRPGIYVTGYGEVVAGLAGEVGDGAARRDRLQAAAGNEIQA